MHTYVVLMYTSETLIIHKAYPSCNPAHSTKGYSGKHNALQVSHHGSYKHSLVAMADTTNFCVSVSLPKSLSSVGLLLLSCSQNLLNLTRSELTMLHL